MVRERAIGHQITAHDLHFHCHVDIFESIPLYILLSFMEYGIQTPCAPSMASYY
jgi:hypothetical protein